MKKILINFILLFIAVLLFAILIIPSFVFGTYHKSWTGGFKGLGDYISGVFRTFAEDIDRSGNFVAGSLLNHIFINKKKAIIEYETVSLFEYPEFCAEYKADRLFGDIRETISSVLGKNQEIGNLTSFGWLICYILDRLEKDHCMKWIAWHPVESKTVRSIY